MTDLSALWLSVRVTLGALILILPLGLGLGLVLAFKRFPGKAALETLLALPLVLPPTVIGYGLLLALGRGTPFGMWLIESAEVQLLFTTPGIVIAATVMALPLFVRTATSAFSAVDLIGQPQSTQLWCEWSPRAVNVSLVFPDQDQSVRPVMPTTKRPVSMKSVFTVRPMRQRQRYGTPQGMPTSLPVPPALFTHSNVPVELYFAIKISCCPEEVIG